MGLLMPCPQAACAGCLRLVGAFERGQASRVFSQHSRLGLRREISHGAALELLRVRWGLAAPGEAQMRRSELGGAEKSPVWLE